MIRTLQCQVQTFIRSSHRDLALCVQIFEATTGLKGQECDFCIFDLQDIANYIVPRTVAVQHEHMTVQ